MPIPTINAVWADEILATFLLIFAEHPKSRFAIPIMQYLTMGGQSKSPFINSA